jgi:protein O-mannosyl-transferase
VTAPRPRVLLGLLLVLYLALLGRTLAYDFVWDDVSEIEHSPLFDGPLLVGMGATQTERTDPDVTHLVGAELPYDSYRPVLFASYWLEIHAFGRSAPAMHLTNLLLGACGILLAYALARRWLPPYPSVAVAAIVALHPLDIEPVAYISGRADLLAGVAALAAAYAAIRSDDSRRTAIWIAASAVAFAVSLFAKESCIALPVVLALWGVTGRRRWTIVGVLGGVALGYLFVRHAIVTATSGHSLIGGVVQLPAVWLEYVKVAVLPFDLSIERLHDARYLWPGVVAMVLVLWRYRAPGLVWFALLLAPAAIVAASSGVAADRYAYAPMFGLAMALVTTAQAIITRWPGARRGLLGAAALWGVLVIAVGVRQVGVWRDNETLYLHALAMSPNSGPAHFRVAYLAAQRDDWDTAIPLLQRAIELAPSDVAALDDLGVGFLRTGKLAAAEATLERAVTVNPAWFRAWYNLGLARLGLGKHDSACQALDHARRINPAYAPAAAEYQRSCK